MARYREGIVLTTSPTQRQVRTQLWSEIHRAVERAKVPYPKLKTTELKFRDDNNFAIGFSTNQSENFQGYHGKYVLIIADEAPGIELGIWDAIAGTMAGGVVHIVMAGNPTVPSGAFFDAFSKERGLRNPFTISAFDSRISKQVPRWLGFALYLYASLVTETLRLVGRPQIIQPSLAAEWEFSVKSREVVGSRRPKRASAWLDRVSYGPPDMVQQSECRPAVRSPVDQPE